MMLRPSLSFALLTSFQALYATAWTVDRAIPVLNRRDASIVAGTAVVGALLLVDPSVATAEDLSSFLDGPRGIKYKILKEGEGETAVRAQQVNTKYTLWTGGFGEDGGKKVDSNTGFMGRPLDVIVGVGRVIKGWDLTLLEMKLGESRRIIVPSDLGYGDAGAGGSIPPKATLYFELEVVDMGDPIDLNDGQKQWLDENPL